MSVVDEGYKFEKLTHLVVNKKPAFAKTEGVEEEQDNTLLWSK
jgi:hypothetical protein